MKSTVLVLFAWAALVITPGVSQNQVGYVVGDVVTDFELMNHNGDMISLNSIPEAKGYIVTFTCNTCPYAVMYEDRLIALHKKYSPMGYHLVAINPNDPDVRPGDSFVEMGVRVSEKDFSFHYLFDEGQKIYPVFGATKTPHIYVLDNDLKVRYIGALDDSPRDEEAVTVRYVEDVLDALEANEEPKVVFTKAIGCSIKTKNMKRKMKKQRVNKSMKSMKLEETKQMKKQ